ncbi:MAG: Clp protease N-terminal domain-containing protein [Thermomicrobiales bacterium]
MSEASQHQSDRDENGLHDPDERSEVLDAAPVEAMATTVHEVLATAGKLAGERGHAWVSTDDIFAAMLSTDCAASRTLQTLNMSTDGLLERLAFILGRDGGVAPRNAGEFSPRVERVMQSARIEAARRKAPAVDTLHLLGALLRERRGVPSLLLETPGLGLEPVGAALNRAIREGMTDPS